MAMSSNSQKKRTVWIGVLLAVVLLGSAGCSDKTEETMDTQATAEVAATPGETQAQTVPFLPAEAPPKTVTAELRYWDVELPEDMIWEEHTEGETYRVEFGMMLDGEKIMLYSVHIGDAPVEKVLGTFTVDGISRNVGVNTYRLATQMILTSDETGATFAARMETLEDVIQAMALNKDFTVGIKA